MHKNCLDKLGKIEVQNLPVIGLSAQTTRWLLVYQQRGSLPCILLVWVEYLLYRYGLCSFTSIVISASLQVWRGIDILVENNRVRRLANQSLEVY